MFNHHAVSAHVKVSRSFVVAEVIDLVLDVTFEALPFAARLRKYKRIFKILIIFLHGLELFFEVDIFMRRESHEK